MVLEYLFLLLPLTVLSQRGGRSGQNGAGAACRDDRQSICGEFDNQADVFVCLEENFALLSQDCQDHLADPDDAGVACIIVLYEYCEDTENSLDIIVCLEELEQETIDESESLCLERFSELDVVACGPDIDTYCSDLDANTTSSTGEDNDGFNALEQCFEVLYEEDVALECGEYMDLYESAAEAAEAAVGEISGLTDIADYSDDDSNLDLILGICIPSILLVSCCVYCRCKNRQSVHSAPPVGSLPQRPGDMRLGSMSLAQDEDDVWEHSTTVSTTSMGGVIQVKPPAYEDCRDDSIVSMGGEDEGGDTKVSHFDAF